jgi:hypothetical protein
MLRDLPAEIITEILERLAARDLVTCMQTANWLLPPAQDLLYRHVVLTERTVGRFTIESNNAVDEKIISLTLVLRKGPYQPGTDRDSAAGDDGFEVSSRGFRSSERLGNCLGALSLRLPKMKNLNSFSISQIPPEPKTSHAWFPLDSVSAEMLIENLPDNCTSLEVDWGTCDNDNRNDTGHICSAIRAVANRLEYLRVRLPWICPDLFQDSCASDTVLPGFPKLIELVINTERVETGSETSLCGADIASSRHSYPSKPWEVLTSQLQASLKKGNLPAIKTMLVLDHQPSAPEASTYATLVRRNVLAESSQFLPCVVFANSEQRFRLVRSPPSEGGDFVFPERATHDVAEGHMWRRATNGSRLPAALLRSSSLEPVHILPNKNQWRNQHRVSCALWSNEEMSGAGLLNPKEAGLYDQLTIRESTPRGWERDEAGVRLISG